MPARTDEIRAAEADARAAREVLAQSEWRLAQRAIASPVTGLVHDTYFVVGDWVPAGAPVASLLPPANVKVRFFVPEPLLGGSKPGQTVTFACDGCGPPMSRDDHVHLRSRGVHAARALLQGQPREARLLVEAKPAPDDRRASCIRASRST